MNKAILVALVCLLASIALGPAQARTYTVRELLGFGDPVGASHMNSSGEVVGEELQPDGPHIVHWSAEGSPTDLGLGSAYDINNSGQILTGISGVGLFIRNRDGSTIPLPSSVPWGARALNDLGHVAGYTTGTEGHAVFWSPETGKLDLGTLPGDVSSRTVDINGSDQVIGWSRNAAREEHPFIWTKSGGMQPLSLAPSRNEGNVMDINEKGQVLGLRYFDNQTAHNVIWNPDGTVFADLGSIATDFFTTGQIMYAMNFNNVGQVVTSSINGPGWVWDSDGTRRQLPFWPDAPDAVPVDINDSGSVLGRCQGPDGLHIVVWDPVPEPSSLIALGSGLLGLVGVMRRRK